MQHDEVIAPFGPTGGGQGSFVGEMVKDLKAHVFPARELKVLAAESGRIGVKVVG